MKIKSILFVTLAFCSCQNTNNEPSRTLTQDELLKRDGAAILSEIKDMTKEDQNIRNYYEYGTIDSTKLNSLSNAAQSNSPIGFAVEEDLNTFSLTENQKDSLNQIITSLQTKHTKRAVEIISKYGFPNRSRVDSNIEYISLALILHHPDLTYKDTLLTLLNKELSLGRIDTNTLEMAKWDLNGRVGIPNIKGVTIVKVNPETGIADTLQK